MSQTHSLSMLLFGTPICLQQPGSLLNDARNPMSGKRPENMSMHRLEQLPVKETGDSFRAERADLDEFVRSASIAKPCFSGKPPDRTQHKSAGVMSNDEPPVNSRFFDNLTWGAELPVLPGDTTDQRTQSPRER